jgi:hypothetical protein
MPPSSVTPTRSVPPYRLLAKPAIVFTIESSM